MIGADDDVPRLVVAVTLAVCWFAASVIAARWGLVADWVVIAAMVTCWVAMAMLVLVSS